MKYFILSILMSLCVVTQAQNIGDFYGSTDGTESIDLTIGKNGSSSTFKIYSEDTGGSSYFRIHGRRWYTGYTWSRQDQGGVTKQMAYLNGGSSYGQYYQLFGNDQDVKIQFHTNGSSFFKGGNVGIGIEIPNDKLDIHQGSLVFSSPNQSITTGTDLNGFRWVVDDNSSGRVSQEAAAIRYLSTGTWNGSASPATISFEIITSANSGLIQRMVINEQGNVGIGTDQPDAKLAVNGNIHATEVKVSTTVPAPDYVFEEDYPLASLDEIKAYITENKHLPEVPSAKEMETNGIKLSEMNMLLLKKVEELTLHLIEQNERMESYEAQLKKQKLEIESLKEQ